MGAFDQASLIVIPFGTDAVAPELISITETADGFGVDCRIAHVVLDRTDAPPLRLNGGGLEFGEPPPLPQMPEVDQQLDYLLAHFQRYCSVWDRYPRAFLTSYFAFIHRHIMDNRRELAQSLARFEDLYRFDQWAFSAPRPLPRAHPMARDAGDGFLPRVDFAFWTGSEIVAIDLIGSATRGKAHEERRAVLARNGVKVIEIPHGILDSAHEGDFAAALPAEFHRFWETEPLPSGPFKTAPLPEIS